MKVKIVKCSDPGLWYINKVGETIDVRDCNSFSSYERENINYKYTCLDFYRDDKFNKPIFKADTEEVEDYDFVKPSHYKLWDGMQEFELHRKLLSRDEYIGFLKGNIIKYQMRLGRKPTEPVERDQEKIKVYSDELERFLKG